MKNSIPSYLLSTDRCNEEYRKGRRVSSPFLDKGFLALSRVLKDTYVQWDLSGRKGLFQRLDPRLKLLFLAFFAILISSKKNIAPELVLTFILLVLNLLSNVRTIQLYSRIVTFSFLFGVLLSLPSALNVIVPGTVVVPLVTLAKDHDLLFYHIPKTVGITREGLHLVALLSLRVANSLTVCLLVLATTPFPDLAKALRLLRIPDLIVMVITLFHKYIFILACCLEEMHLAMKSRLISAVPRNQARIWATGRMAYVYRKSQHTCDEVFKAMVSRGFTGEMRLAGSHTLARIDWFTGAALLAAWLLVMLL